MKTLNRLDLLKKEVLKVVKVDLGNNEFVYVREMTGHERDHFEQALIKEVKDRKGKVISYEKNTEDYRGKLAVQSVCDEDGTLIFKAEDAAILSSNMSASRLDKIVREAQKLNGLTEDEAEDALKNSDAAQSGNSISDSVES